MHQPMKQLPERAISEEEARKILRIGEHCVVATVDADGHPYATPLSYVLDGDALLIHTGIAGARRPRTGSATRACASPSPWIWTVYVEEDGAPASSPRASRV